MYNNKSNITLCSNCGNEINLGQNLCKNCEQELQLESSQFIDEDDLDDEDMPTLCILQEVRTFDFFSIARIKKDVTPRMLDSHPNFENLRLIEEPNRNEFYIFKNDLFPYLHMGKSLHLYLENYLPFKTMQGFKLKFDQQDFTPSELLKLNNYNLE